ncbi:MAG: family 20 glycosylhydrolase, partial [Bacteroidia bacterium]
AGGIDAAKQSHDVIMTPGSAGLYFDHKQSASPDEPLTIGGLSSYAKVYAYDPVPKELTVDQQKYILGVQANIWSEYIETPSKVEFMLLPRLLSLSEIAWSKLSNKDFKNFSEERVPLHLARLDKTSTNYWVPTALGQPDKPQVGENFTIELKAPVAGAKIFYTLDNYRPSENATEYRIPIKINVPQGQKKVLKTIVIAPSGRRSVVAETLLNNGAVEVKSK